MVPQEGFLFHGDLRTNLRFGKGNEADDELWRALALVQLDDTIKKRGGLGAEVALKGLYYSLGERQFVSDSACHHYRLTHFDFRRSDCEC